MLVRIKADQRLPVGPDGAIQINKSRGHLEVRQSAIRIFVDMVRAIGLFDDTPNAPPIWCSRNGPDRSSIQLIDCRKGFGKIEGQHQAIIHNKAMSRGVPSIAVFVAKAACIKISIEEAHRSQPGRDALVFANDLSFGVAEAGISHLYAENSPRRSANPEVAIGILS